MPEMLLIFCRTGKRERKTMSKTQGAEGENQKREDRRVRRTRAGIRRAFLELLDEKDYGQITVTELSERADINRKTFYAYYSGMEDLLRDLEKDLLADYGEICAGTDFFIPEFDGRIFFSRISQIIDANLEVLKRLGELGVLPDLMVRIKDMTIERFLEKNTSGADQTDTRIVLAAEFIATGALAMFSRWAVDQGMDLDEFVDFAGALAVGGIREAFLKAKK